MTDRPRAWIPATHDGACSGSPFEHPSGGWCAHESHALVMKPKNTWRATWLPSPQFYNLNQACTIINKAFDEPFKSFGCYLVGSSIQRPDWRDVDVRYIMGDAAYDRLFGSGDAGWTNAFWSLLCTTISAWLSQQSGLPVDFQIQRQSEANRDHPSADGNKRQPLGIFLDYPGERPTDVTKSPEETK